LTLEQEACYAAVANGALRAPDGVLTGYMHSHAAGACAGEVRVGVWFFSLIMIKRQKTDGWTAQSSPADHERARGASPSAPTPVRPYLPQ